MYFTISAFFIVKIYLMNCTKKLLQIFIFFYSIIIYTQSYEQDILRGYFTYKLNGKFDKRTDTRYEEFFSLQISDKRAFFSSINSIKRDSAFQKIQPKTLDNGAILLSSKGIIVPETQFYFTIIQSTENVQFFDSAFMSLLTYKEPVIKNWKLTDEVKVINTINCKRADVTFKGRNWIAWYAPEIPFPYGPMKFSGLPGLIIKITDDKGDFDFELVKSVSGSKLKGKLINIKKSRYTNAIETTQAKLKQAKRNVEKNAAGVMASYGTTVVKGQEILRQREKEREENEKFANPLELTP